MYVKNVDKLAVREVLVEVPSEAFLMLEENYGSNSVVTGQVVDFSVRKLNQYKQPNQIREALIKGYVEMSHINLTICNECLHAEYEAEHMVERLVSGG